MEMISVSSFNCAQAEKEVAKGKNILPFTKFFKDIKHFLWLFGQTVLTQLFQLAVQMKQTSQPQ